jgi:hypothetical protein
MRLDLSSRINKQRKSRLQTKQGDGIEEQTKAKGQRNTGGTEERDAFGGTGKG